MSEIKEKISRLKARINNTRDDVEDLKERVERLERQSRRQSRQQFCDCGADHQQTAANPFAMFGLTPGVNLPPLGTRLSREDLTTLAKGLAVGMGIPGAGAVVDAFFGTVFSEEDKKAKADAEAAAAADDTTDDEPEDTKDETTH